MEKKSTTLELTINPGYVRGWSIWEATRELIQNAADAHDCGYPMKISFERGAEIPYLQIETEGATITREALLLGSTTKADDRNQRGQFGEGIKLAFLIFARNDRAVWCKSGDERWVPAIGHSTSYGVDVLQIKVSPLKFENKVIIRVQLKPEEWDEVRSRILFLDKPDPDEFIELGQNKILTGEQYCGHLYVKGIWVTQLPDKYRYGYDLFDVEIDRDRRIADPWSLKYNISRVLIKAVEAGHIDTEQMYQLLNGDWEEARIAGDYTHYSTPLTKKMAEHFQSEFGDEAVPVSTTPESVEAKNYGLRGVVVNPGLRSLIEHEFGKFEDRRKAKAIDIVERLSEEDLCTKEAENLVWACKLVHRVAESFDTVVVAFRGEHVRSSRDDENSRPVVNLAFWLLKNRAELISALVSELAKNGGEEGTDEYQEELLRIFGQLVAELE